MTLDLNHVRIFVEVVRARSFAEAARRSGIPPNTLSRHIRHLEASLDTRLLQRSTRRLTLTSSGAEFYARCAVPLDTVFDAGKEIVGARHTPSGSVRVAAPADFLDLFDIEWVAEFLRNHPKVKLDFVLNDARADLIGESIDVAFRGGATRDPQFVYRQLSAQDFKLVASPRYLEQRGWPRTLQALVNHDCLTGSARVQPTVWKLSSTGGSEEVSVDGTLSGNSTRILLQACLRGLGVALLPNMLVRAELEAGRLLRVLPEYHRDGAAFCVILPSRQQIPAAVSAFIEFAAMKLESLMAYQEH